jgi:hypothetical protein
VGEDVVGLWGWAWHTALHSDVILQDNDMKARIKALEKAVADLQKK